eukprot:Ihof_evm1s1087 gene=Ihof_evmTU1s1087
MLQLTSIVLFALAHVGSSALCNPERSDFLGGWNLKSCELQNSYDFASYKKITLPRRRVVDAVSFSLRAPLIKHSIKYTITVDGKWCSDISLNLEVQNFEIVCPEGGLIGSVIEWKTEQAPPPNFMFCNFNACGHDLPGEELRKIDLIGLAPTQSSTYSDDTVAFKGIDGDSSTCTNTIPYLSNQPWWDVDLGAEVAVHYVKITNRNWYRNRLGNVVVTVDGNLCSSKNVFTENNYYLTVTCEKPIVGRVLKIQLKNAPVDGILTVCEVEVFGVLNGTQIKTDPVPKVDLRGLMAKQSSTWSDATVPSMAIDGNALTCTNTYNGLTSQPWWIIDMGASVTIHSFKITNRRYYESRLGNVAVTVDGKLLGNVYRNADNYYLWITLEKPVTGQVLKIQLLDAPDDGILTLCEVEVFGYVHGSRVIANPVPKLNLSGRDTQQSSTYKDDEDYVSWKAIDGKTNTCTWTAEDQSSTPWWTLIMSRYPVTVHTLKIWNNSGYKRYLGNVQIKVDEKLWCTKYVYATVDYLWISCPEPITGKVLTIQLMDAPVSGYLSLCEVEVYGYRHI